MVKKLSYLSLLIIFLLTLSSCDFGGEISYEEPKPEDEVENGEPNPAKFDVSLDFDATKGIVSLYESIENGVYFIITESKAGNTFKEAIIYFKNGTQQTIKDIQEFAITSDILKVKVEFQPGITLEGFKLDADSYTGYYLGNDYTLQITPQFYPEDASNKTIKYFTTNDSVASVNKFGKVTVKGPGTAVISALTLEGNHRQDIQMNIINGKTVLKDTMSMQDYNEQNLIGTRYDENSVQESSYKAVEIGKDRSFFVAVGTSKVDNDRSISLFSKFSMFSEMQSSRANIDPQDLIYSEELNELSYSFDQDAYFAVGSYKTSKNSKIGSLIVKVSEDITTDQTAFVIEKLVQTEIESRDRVYLDVIANAGFVYAIGYEIEYTGGFIGIGEKKVQRGLIDIYDSNLEFIKTINISEAEKYTAIKYNSYNNRFVLASKTTSSTYLLEWDPVTQVTSAGYYSDIPDAVIVDFTIVDDSTYIAVGNGVVNEKPISFILKIIKSNGNLIPANSVKNEIYSENYAVAVLYNNGIVSVVGYGAERTGNIFGYTYWEYSIVTNYDKNLSQINNGVKFLNGNIDDKRGTKQRFNDALITPFNQMVAVGESNYYNKDYNNAYIQFDIKFIS